MAATTNFNTLSFASLPSEGGQTAIKYFFERLKITEKNWQPQDYFQKEISALFTKDANDFFDPEYEICLWPQDEGNLQPNKLYVQLNNDQSFNYQVFDACGERKTGIIKRSDIKKFRGSFNQFDDIKKAKNRILKITAERGHTYSNTYAIFKSRAFLSESVATFSQRINEQNPASFQFLSNDKRQQLEEELLFAFYLFSAQYHLDETESRKKNLNALGDKIKHTALLVNALRLSKNYSPAAQHEDQVSNSQKPCLYLVLKNLSSFVSQKVDEFTSGKSTIINQWMNDINERRLYWVWGGGVLASVFSALPEHFAQKPLAEEVLAYPNPALGYFSWMLYYARMGLQLSLLLKHTFSGPWMSKRERIRIPAIERFTAQWDQRRFALLNDSVWATVNLITFFWLKGSGMLGYYGNVLTVGLLLVDASLTFWKYMREQSKHNKLKEGYIQSLEKLDDKINALDNQLEQLGKQIKNSADNSKAPQLAEKQLDLMNEKKVLNDHKKSLQTAADNLRTKWRFKKYHLAIGLAYSVGLILTFTLACSLFFPPGAIAPATAMIIGLAGAALCFALTFAYSLATGAIDVAQTRHQKNAAKNECKACVEEFKILKIKFDNTEDEDERKLIGNEMRLYYLEIQRLRAESDFQARVVNFQIAKLIRSAFIDAMIPPLIFVSLLFMPIGVGLGVLASGLALAGLSHIVLNRFKPKASENDQQEKSMDALLKFDETNYQSFVAKIKGNESYRHSIFGGLFTRHKIDKSEQGDGYSLLRPEQGAH